MTSSNNNNKSESSSSKNRTKPPKLDGNGNGNAKAEIGILDVLRTVFTMPKIAIGLALFALGFAISHNFNIHFEKDEFPVWQRFFHGTVWFLLYFLTITLYSLYMSFS